MALKIQRRKWRTRSGAFSEGWRLIIEDYTHGDRRDLYPRREDYGHYGLDPSDTYEVARGKLDSIQAQNKKDRKLERIARIQDRLKKEDLIETAYLPRGVYSRYLVWLQRRRLWETIPSKTESHLRAMRKLIMDIDTDPSDWPEQPEQVYRWFLTRKLSLSYVDKVLPLLNDYGYFYCREFKRPFVPIPAPRGDIARRIDDANIDDREGFHAPSKPLRLEHLAKLAVLGPERARWIRLSYYFGLRPSEVDKLILANKCTVWEAKRDAAGTWVFHFYQKKLIKVERARRWKRIPCILKEQVELVQELLLGMPFARPYYYNISDTIGAGHTLYAGRKGFEPLMRAKGQTESNISRWLGHHDPKTTERHYRDSESVAYDPVP